jgi:hypothetical protein
MSPHQCETCGLARELWDQPHSNWQAISGKREGGRRRNCGNVRLTAIFSGGFSEDAWAILDFKGENELSGSRLRMEEGWFLSL